MNAMLKRARRKRGIILMVVISLLTLFILLGVTYTLVATQYREAAGNVANIDRFGDDPVREANLVLDQLISGAPGNSSLKGHDLLGDLYGNDYVKGTVNSAALDGSTGNQFLTVNYSVLQNASGGAASALVDYYNGRVITFTSGKAKGLSTRVVAYDPTISQLKVDTISASVVPDEKSEFIINGAPFNGVGFGYDSTTRTVTKTDADGSLLALLPHFAGFDSDPGVLEGGQDESWDAVDANNMHLAFVPADSNRLVDSVTGRSLIVPSFHRPELMNYWINNGATPDLLRKVSFRPLTQDHPSFNGSNPNYHPVNGPWDVDNDNDGYPDSIWIDPGLPVVTAPNGRRYKRLVALLIKDLDGRINVNAHGNTYQARGVEAGGYPGYRSDDPIGNHPLSGQPWGRVPAGSYLPRGIGVGPAEVDFRFLFGGDSNTYLGLLNGRYGADGVPGALGNDPMSIVRFHGLFAGYPGPNAHGWYASPPDTWGRWAIGRDITGFPFWTRSGTTYLEGSDDPYEMEFDQLTAANDQPYTVAELERLLRYHDADAPMLPSRLETLGNGYLNGDSRGQPDPTKQKAREMLTTISSHLPVVENAYVRHLRSSVNPGQSTILDLYRAKIRNVNPTATDAHVNNLIAQIAPWEFRHGQRLDINRYLGDGVDTDGDGAADDDQELSAGTETAWTDNVAVHGGNVRPEYQGVTAQYANGIVGNGRYGRQLLARHLYCLMLLLTDDAFLNDPPDTFPDNEANDAASRSFLLRRRIAQWAVNVVDFRDPDGIMTRFDYDPNPWDGWDPPNDGSRTVWGCEQPDLLIGETLAFHDRRVKDTAYDDNNLKKRDEPGAEYDETLDQFGIPEGSLFVELYCPRSADSVKLPQELYGTDSRLKLGKFVGGRPVWRLAISRLTRGMNQTNTPDQMAGSHPESISFEPRDMLLLDGTPVPVTIEREVWFTPGLGNEAETAQNVFFSTANPDLAPGQYAVVGPRQTTYLGSLDPAAADPSAIGIWGGHSKQRIELGAGTVTITDISGTPISPAPPNPVVPIIASMPPPAATDGAYPGPIGVNISEPLPHSGNYYPPPPTGANPPFLYGNAETPDPTFPDLPLDSEDNRPLVENDMLRTGTYQNAATIFVQRLADPTKPFNDDPTSDDYNPYITVDWAAVDLTVFTGEEDTTQEIVVGMDDRGDIDPDDPATRTEEMRFGTRERGYQDGVNQTGNLWPPITKSAEESVDTGNSDSYFAFDLTGGTVPYLRQTLGYLNSKVDTADANGNPSTRPIPWLCWNNRPYSNPMELLMVPSASPSRLLWEVTPGPLSSVGNWYDPSTDESFRAGFVHLLNFFHSSNRGTSQAGADFYRLFDFVEVPSPFTHVDRFFKPSSMASASTFRPPFNRMSRFRDPGRININTVPDEDVLRAAIEGMGLHGSLASERNTIINRLLQGRHGTAGSWWDFVGTSSNPVHVSNPFRTADSADLMPRDPGMTSTIDLTQPFPVQATLLRSENLGTSTPTIPIFNVPNSTSNPRYLDEKPEENAYFKFQRYQKIGNLFSTHSNCYAVWMTIGYFEVSEVPDPPTWTHPDGYQLGMELGADTGEITRHRSFFIIDRSIPVAYEPGQRHNTDRTVLLRRYIE